jgi:hypothetical protein
MRTLNSLTCILPVVRDVTAAELARMFEFVAHSTAFALNFVGGDSPPLLSGWQG